MAQFPYIGLYKPIIYVDCAMYFDHAGIYIEYGPLKVTVTTRIITFSSLYLPLLLGGGSHLIHVYIYIYIYTQMLHIWNICLRLA